MPVIVLFQFNHEEAPVAVTGIEGDVQDLLLPYVGDLVRHGDSGGTPFEGEVTERIFSYDLPNGHAVQGAVSVTLCMDRTLVQ